MAKIGGFYFGVPEKRPFRRKLLLAHSCDSGTCRIHRGSAALFRCKSGTGPSPGPGITSASPGIVLVIAALDYIMCSMSRSNDGAHEDRTVARPRLHVSSQRKSQTAERCPGHAVASPCARDMPRNDGYTLLS